MSDTSNVEAELQKEMEEARNSIAEKTARINEPVESLFVLMKYESPKFRDQVRHELIHSFTKSLLLAVVALFLLASIALAIYLTSNKALGEASSLISTVVGALVAVVVGYYFGRSKEQRIESRIEEIREKEKAFYERISKDIKIIVEKAH